MRPVDIKDPPSTVVKISIRHDDQGLFGAYLVPADAVVGQRPRLPICVVSGDLVTGQIVTDLTADQLASAATWAWLPQSTRAEALTCAEARVKLSLIHI